MPRTHVKFTFGNSTCQAMDKEHFYVTGFSHNTQYFYEKRGEKRVFVTLRGNS